MQRALQLAQQAGEQGEVPVGALLVLDGQLVAEGWNCPIANHDPTGHAEIITLRKAGKALETYRLNRTTLYVTLEPCAMCAGAMIHARVARLVFGAYDSKSGACGSVLDVCGCDRLNHRMEVVGGIEAKACGDLLKEFFRARR